MLVGTKGAIGVSAVTGEGIEELLAAIEKAFEETLRPMRLLFPYDAGGALSDLHALAGRIEREDTPDGVLVERPRSRCARPSLRAIRARAGLALGERRRRRGLSRQRRRLMGGGELSFRLLSDRGATAQPGAPRRRRPRPLRGRARDDRAWRARRGRLRRCRRDPRGPRRPRAAPQRQRGTARDRARQRSRADRRRLPGRDPRAAAQHRPDEPFKVEPGDRIAQLLVTPFAASSRVAAEELGEQSRRGGFGSSGR